jgi:O-antigen/teichoic acid export membrane protein
LSGTSYRLVRNSTFLLGGQILAKAVGVVYGIALSRYLGASGFGEIGAAIAVSTVAYVFVDFGLAPLMTRDVAADHGVATRYATNVVGLKLLLTAVVNLGLLAFLAASAYSAELKTIVLLYSLNGALSAIVNVGGAGLQGIEEMHKVAVLQLGRDLLNFSVSLAAIALSASIFTLVWVSVGATALQLAFMRVVAFRNGIRFDWVLLSARFARYLLKGSLPFAAFTILATVNAQVAVLLVSLLMSNRETGLYSAAVNLSALVALFPAAFAQAVFPVFSRYHASQSELLKVSYDKMFRYMVILGFGVSAAAALAVKPALLLLLGREYVSATGIAVVLVLTNVLAANFVNGTFLNAAGRQTLFTVSYGIAILAQLTVSALLIPRLGGVGAALGFLIPGFVGYAYYTVVCHRIVGSPLPWMLHAKCLFAVGLMVLAALGSARLGLGMLAAALIVGPIVYGVVVFALRTISRSDLLLFREAIAPISARLAGLRGGTH